MRKLLAILFSISLFLGMGSNAFANENEPSKEVKKAYQLIDKTNEKIYELIAKAIEKGDKLQANYQTELRKLEEKGLATSKNVDNLTKDYNEKLDKLISELHRKTLEMSTETIEQAAKAGVEAVCTWVEVTIGDRKEMIDPIHIVGEV